MSARTTRILALLLLLPAAAGHALGEKDVLRPEAAFRYAVTDTGDALQIDWAIEDGYYLYRRKMSFESNTASIVLDDAEMPQGEIHEDEFFGVQQIYRERFLVRVPYSVSGERPESMELVLNLQGCADIGICYPPQTWTRPVRLATTSAAAEEKPAKLTFGSSFGNSPGEFLPVDEAFKPMIIPVDGNNVEVSLQVARGYYLYKDKISASAKSDRVRLGRLELPEGEMKTDEYFGEMEVYHDDVFARLPLVRATPDAMNLEIELGFQGCADGGICYPPTTRTLHVTLPAASADTALAAVSERAPPVTEQARLAELIGTGNIWLIVATFFGAGLLLAFTPCVLPMVPILSGIIAGEGENVSTARGFSLALTYVMGMALVYTAAGVAAAAVGLQLQAIFNQPWVLTLFAGLFVVLALGMFGLYELQMPSAIQTRLSTISGGQKSGTAVGAFVMGALSALIVTACVAPALIAALTVMAQSGDMLRGGTALFAMSLGMGAPLLAVGAAQGRLLPTTGPWMVAVKNAFGFMMLGLAIWMLSRFLPGTATLALWGVLIFMAGVYLGGFTTLTRESPGVYRLGKGFGLLAIVYGAVLIVGSLAGSDSMLRPFSALNTGGQSMLADDGGLEFRRIKSVGDLEQALATASAEGKTAMLDFYADWCVSCIEMEKYTFTDAAVQDALADTVLLQADVTANDEEDQGLMKRFGVFGPPTIIFFGSDGLQRNGYEVVGFMKATQFTEHVHLALGTTDTLAVQQTRE
ncbi:MAG: protein-disulfide reductase DsbD [Woeseia sp.]